MLCTLKGHWVVSVLASILILGTLGIPHSFAQLCPLVPGCLTDNLYVAGSFFNAVRQFDSAGTLLDASFITGLSFPISIAFDSTGKLYVADLSLDTVRQYDSAGTLLDASFITGLSDPRGIAFDSTGKLYVVDFNLDAVLQYDSAGTLLDASFITGLSLPHSLAFDSTGNLYVADFSLDAVRQYDSTGTLLDASFITVTDPRSIAFDTLQAPVGGTFLPIDTTALLVAGAQTTSPWLILGVVAAVGIGFAVFTIKRR